MTCNTLPIVHIVYLLVHIKIRVQSWTLQTIVGDLEGFRWQSHPSFSSKGCLWIEIWMVRWASLQHGMKKPLRCVRLVSEVSDWCPRSVRSCPIVSDLKLDISMRDHVRKVSAVLSRQCPKHVRFCTFVVRSCPEKCPECPIRAQVECAYRCH